MRISLRDVVTTDSNFIFDVRRSAFRAYAELDGGWDEREELERHLERLARQRFRIVVADGIDVGYVASAVYAEATSAYPKGLYLHQLMLLPEYQSQGIGSSCLGVIAKEAHNLGLPLRSRVLRVNPRALAFYLAAGFDITGESESHIALEMSA